MINDEFNFKISEEKIFDNIHYKYKFRIQPFEEENFVRPAYKRAYINFTYPEILNFTSAESLIIRYIMSDPSLAANPRINIYEDLECVDLDEMKKCLVPLSHFRGKKIGYYGTYHLHEYYYGQSFKYNELSPIYVEKLNDNDIVINIPKKENQGRRDIGDEGTLDYITDYNDSENNIFDSFDIEEKTTFQTSFIEEKSGNNYKISCRLWKPNYGNLRIFCKLKESLKDNDDYHIKINNYNFNYGKYNIFINFDLNRLWFFQLKYAPFLYSDEQIINIEDEKDFYNLKFNIESYDNEMLYIGGKSGNRKMLNNCKVKKKELICEIKNEDLIGILPMNGGNLLLYYFEPEYEKIMQYRNVYNITINIKNL